MIRTAHGAGHVVTASASVVGRRWRVLQCAGVCGQPSRTRQWCVRLTELILAAAQVHQHSPRAASAAAAGAGDAVAGQLLLLLLLPLMALLLLLATNQAITIRSSISL
jgi:hypothetical protein